MPEMEMPGVKAEKGDSYEIFTYDDLYGFIDRISKGDNAIDGNGCAIENLTIDSSALYVGLFASVTETGTVKNLTLKGGSISGGEGFMGGITAANHGNVINCHNSASVTSKGKNIYKSIGA